MRYFAAFLAQEQLRIGKAVKALTAQLPDYVRDAASYALSSGGKRLRPALVILCARALGHTGDNVYTMGAPLEMLHVATLMHDDILDNSETRRSHLATHLKYGVPVTLLAADAMVARAFQSLGEPDDPRFMRCLSKAVVGTMNGEIMEIALQGKTDGGLQTYIDVIEGKTAYLLQAACEVGALCAGASDEAIAAVSAYGLNLGVAFQIADDVLDFQPTEITGKPCGGDLREGKFTPPIAYYTESLGKAERADFVKKFSSRTLTDAEVDAIAVTIREGGFQEKAKALSDSYLAKAEAALALLPTSADDVKWARDALAEALVFVRDRKA